MNCQNVTWAAQEHLCSLHRWSHIGSSISQEVLLPRMDVEQDHDSFNVNMGVRAESSKEEVGLLTEDGELPSLIPAAVVADDRSTANINQGLGVNRSKRMTLISKSVALPVRTARNQSFGRYEEDTDLILDSESEVDDPIKIESENDIVIEENHWVDYGVKEFNLVLTRKRDGEDNVDLEAKIKIGMEYPLRPPLFKLDLLSVSPGRNYSSIDQSVWYNELRAMEAEVNLHLLKMLPLDQENYILSHQVHCLAMLFDLYLNEASRPSEGKNCNSVIDIGLCTPVSCGLKARSFRGRDRRKMMSWKDKECTHGYPF